MNNFNKTILVIHAHPDDTEAFCAGSLRLLKERGYRISIATMTGGGMGGIGSDEKTTEAQRHEEAKKAAAVLDADYHCFGGRDGYLYDTEELRIATTAHIRRVKAGIVMTHLPTDYHSDHRATCNIVETASMQASLPYVPCNEEPLEITPLLYHTAPLGFSDPLGGTVTPHFAVNISETIDTKMEMLKYHESQIELMSVMHKIDNFFDEMKQYNLKLGKMCGCEYAEIYWQHLGGGFQKDPLIQKELADYIKPFKGQENNE